MSGNTGAWGVLLEGVYIDGGCDSVQSSDILDECTPPGGDAPFVVVGEMSVPPEGLGLPEIRSEEATYPQRDGVVHFADWYEPRIITLEDVSVCNDGCPGCPSARQKIQQISKAWGRKCDDVELVIFTDCHDPTADEEGRAVTGPFGVIGRPRAAEVEWQTSDKGCALVTLRFDARDHRAYVLDACGTPGSGEKCAVATPTTETTCRTYPRCYPYCYDTETGEEGGDATATVYGTECVNPTITLCGDLTSPRIENVETGATLTYNGTIRKEDECVVIDTINGTATQGEATRTHLLTGDTRMILQPGENTIRLTSFATTDDGSAEVCWRSIVVMM